MCSEVLRIGEAAQATNSIYYNPNPAPLKPCALCQVTLLRSPPPAAPAGKALGEAGEPHHCSSSFHQVGGQGCSQQQPLAPPEVEGGPGVHI